MTQLSTNIYCRFWFSDEEFQDLNYGEWMRFHAFPKSIPNAERIHRSNGPAAEYQDGVKIWYHRGKIHRTNGPSIEQPNQKHRWHIRGRDITGLVDTEIAEGRLSKWPGWTRNDYLYFKLKFC